MSLMASMSTGPLAHTFGRETLSAGIGLGKDINSTLESHVQLFLCDWLILLFVVDLAFWHHRKTHMCRVVQTHVCRHKHAHTFRTLQHVLVGVGGGTTECESTKFCLLRS